MIDLAGMISISYLKKSRFTGSYQGMRYALHKKEQEASEMLLEAVVWPEPFNYDTTAEEKKCRKSFAFNQEGLAMAVAWLNEYHGHNFVL